MSFFYRPQKLIATFLSLVFLATMLAGCNDDVPVEEDAVKIDTANEPALDDSNKEVFAQEIVSEYLQLSDQLMKQYASFKAADDEQGFLLYRNKHWTPAYIEKKTVYESILFKHKAFIYRNQLNVLFETFSELQKLSLHLKHSLRDKDWSLEQQAMARLVADRSLMMGYIDKP